MVGISHAAACLLLPAFCCLLACFAALHFVHCHLASHCSAAVTAGSSCGVTPTSCAGGMAPQLSAAPLTPTSRADSGNSSGTPHDSAEKGGDREHRSPVPKAEAWKEKNRLAQKAFRQRQKVRLGCFAHGLFDAPCMRCVQGGWQHILGNLVTCML